MQRKRPKKSVAEKFCINIKFCNTSTRICAAKHCAVRSLSLNGTGAAVTWSIRTANSFGPNQITAHLQRDAGAHEVVEAFRVRSTSGLLQQRQCQIGMGAAQSIA